jgi:arylsulfatase A
MTRIVLLAVACAFTFAFSISRAASAATPNVVLIFCDDMGYADIGPFGAKIPTPNLDRMAREGNRFTTFYVAQAVCSASRAALLTGCYSNRVSIQGALPPRSPVGINGRELTMGEMFKSRGYATAIYGKWHLGDAPQFLPTRHGFDEYYGLPYSNDMWPKHPDSRFPPLPLIDGERIVETNPDQRKLTTSYTEHAVSFIDRNKDKPFFLYVPHSMPHVPLAVSDKFAGKSGQGMYGDVIAEIDWSVGQILDALERNNLDNNTLVIFTSDNGPWLSYGDHAGSAGALREGKAGTFEGGVREPCIMRWPGKIPAGVVTHELAVTFDLMPTFAKLIGAELPPDRIIDGKDIAPLIFNTPGAKTPHEVFYYYWGKRLDAVRAGKWKLIFPHEFNSKPPDPIGGGKPTKYIKTSIELSLYDLEADPGETKNVIADHADVVARLQALAERAREDLGDSLTNRAGKNVREPGRLPAAATTSSAATAPAVSPSPK